MIGLIRLTSNKTNQNQNKGCQVKLCRYRLWTDLTKFKRLLAFTMLLSKATVNTNRERGKKLFEKSVTAICNETQRVMIMFTKVKFA